MEKQLSIIIPTYNMEKWLPKCLDSLLIPEIDAVEVLVVNDGSKDNSLEIALEYEKKFPNSIKVIDKANGNYGSCINAALPLVKGKYVKVLDADDSFDSDVLSQFVRMLADIDADAVLTEYCTVDKEGNIIKKYDLKKFNLTYNKVYSFTEVEDNLASNHSAMHRITYKTILFKTFVYRQTEGISYTDTEWAIVPMSFARSICLIDIKLYRYTLGRENQTMDAAFNGKRAKILLDIINHIIKDYLSYAGLPNKLFLRKQIARLHHFPFHYYSGIKDNGEAMSILKVQDNHIKEIDPLIYKEIGNLDYEPYMDYKFIKRIRKNNYQSKSLGLGSRLWLSLNYILHSHGISIKRL